MPENEQYIPTLTFGTKNPIVDVPIYLTPGLGTVRSWQDFKAKPTFGNAALATLSTIGDAGLVFFGAGEGLNAAVASAKAAQAAKALKAYEAAHAATSGAFATAKASAAAAARAANAVQSATTLGAPSAKIIAMERAANAARNQARFDARVLREMALATDGSNVARNTALVRTNAPVNGKMGQTVVNKGLTLVKNYNPKSYQAIAARTANAAQNAWTKVKDFRNALKGTFIARTSSGAAAAGMHNQ